MNRTRMLVLALFALALSGLVTFLVYQELNTRLNPATEETELVVVASERLSLGSRIGDLQVKAVPWPRGLVPDGSYKDPKEVVNRAVLFPIFPNEPILESKLAAEGAGAGLPATIPEGMRAVSVRVNDVVGVAGFVGPGTRVDVILTGSPDGTAIDTAKVIMENVEVLAAGQNVERDAAGKPQTVPVVTLLVTPDDAQKLVMATMDGQIQLALRNPIDLERSDPAAFNRRALYTTPATTPVSPAVAAQAPPVRRAIARPAAVQPEPPPPPPRTFTVELIQGSKREDLKFEEEVEKRSEADKARP